MAFPLLFTLTITKAYTDILIIFNLFLDFLTQNHFHFNIIIFYKQFFYKEIFQFPVAIA